MIRGSEVVFSTPAQQHDFNFPYQLGSESLNDAPDRADSFTVEVKPGDVVITASDGLWDNLWNNEVVALVGEAKARSKGPKALASVLAKQAQRRGLDQQAWSPFMHGALQKGFAYMGGKIDDVTIVVAYVRDGAEDAPGKLDRQASAPEIGKIRPKL